MQINEENDKSGVSICNEDITCDKEGGGGS